MIPYLDSNEDGYYKLRLALRYCLKSPSRESMRHLKSEHLTFLLNEVDIEDTKFLQSLLDERNQNQMDTISTVTPNTS